MKRWFCLTSAGALVRKKLARKGAKSSSARAAMRLAVARVLALAAPLLQKIRIRLINIKGLLQAEPVTENAVFDGSIPPVGTNFARVSFTARQRMQK
jgi:hypothetical protein